MLGKMARICPHCGKKLSLVGRTLGDEIHGTINNVSKNVTYEYEYYKVFDKDDLWSAQVDMFCAECGMQIKLQSNPQYLLIIAMMLCLLLLLLLGLTLLALIPFKLAGIMTILIILFDVTLICLYIFKIKFIKKWHSNFIYVSDKPIAPTLSFSADVSKLPKQILNAANIFTFDSNTRRYALYLTDFSIQNSDVILEVKVCGNNNDVSSFITFIQEYNSQFNLNFEGKYNICVQLNEIYV